LTSCSQLTTKFYERSQIMSRLLTSSVDEQVVWRRGLTPDVVRCAENVAVLNAAIVVLAKLSIVGVGWKQCVVSFNCTGPSSTAF